LDKQSRIRSVISDGSRQMKIHLHPQCNTAASTMQRAEVMLDHFFDIVYMHTSTTHY